jgi:hypothetical protein
MNLFLEYRAAQLGIEEAGALVIRNFSIWPNPAHGSAVLHFDLAEHARLCVSLYDMAGRLVYTRSETEYGTGTHNLQLNTAALGSGVYFLRISGENSDFMTEKVVIINE